MMYVLLLFAEELRTNGIERIASQFVFSLHKLKDIQLKTALQPSLLRVSLTKALGGEMGVLGFRFVIFERRQIKGK
jgi:hypothetical protein